MTIKKLKAELARTRKELAEGKHAMRELGKVWPKVYFRVFKDLVKQHTDENGNVDWDHIEKSLGRGSRALAF